MTENTTESLPVENPAESGVLKEKYLIFSIKDKQYALPSMMINEVTVLEKVFPMPLVPAYVRGIINRYSIPYALIDIGFILYNELSNAQKVVVLKEEIDKIAFLIDDVTDIADIMPENILKIEHEENTFAASINAFFELNGNHVFCIDTEDLINKIKQDFDREL
ncbi:MAG: chemotaxis protein CheW [Treponema sp.]|nr:chemotaxis protein CheW [Treponema sp.]